MNDLNPITPGKLKRKSKRSTSASVVDLPVVSNASVQGNLLGDTLVKDSSASMPAISPHSLLGFTSDSTEIQTQDSEKNNAEVSSHSSMDDGEPVVTFKMDTPQESRPSSPLDLLHVDNDEDAWFEDELAEPVVTKPIIRDVTPKSDAKPLKKSTQDAQTLQILRLSGKKKPSKTQLPAAEIQSGDISRLEELLTQTRETNQKCLDTLAKLQNTNAQNERRYTLNLIIAFSILAILTVIGVFVGTGLKNEAKLNDFKFKHEAYTNAVNARKILEAEFEKEKRGSAAAFEVYQRIEQGLFEESVEKFTEVRDELTHPAEIALLEQRIDEIRTKLAENAYHDGVMLYNASNFEQARDAFFKSLSYKENTAYSPRLNYYHAMSLFELGDFEGARRYFAYINSADISADMDAQARFHRAIAAEKLGDDADAYEQFDQFLRKYRYHRLADEAAKHRAKIEPKRRQ